jgi:YVTN family beta-propeller protein
VTFLFTDIEGSTRLVKELRGGYPAVLADHRDLLRAAFAAHDGYEVDTQGDSFFVAFASARDALLAAVEGQLALGSHEWPAGVEIKVRMGLHTGQAVASDGRYTGLAVHRAARIGAAGHGGQILVSQATQTLLEDEEEDLHISLRDLGEQRLKDLDRPVRLYQAAADGLPHTFPPVRGDAHLAQAAETALRRPWWRRPAVLAAAAAVLMAVVASALLLGRGSEHGLSGVDANNVGIIDPSSNTIVGEAPVGIRPGPVAAGEGFVWVGNLDDRTITKIDAVQRASAGTITLGDRTPTGLAAGLGAVWVAHGLLGAISRVDPQFNRVTDTVPLASPASRIGSTAVGEGWVWAAFGDSTLARVDPVDVKPLSSTVGGQQPSAIVVGNGSIWVADVGDSTVKRFHPTTFEEGAVRRYGVGSRPLGIAFGEGAIWVANASDDSVTRIDPFTGSSRTISVGQGPTAVAVGSGAVWVSNTADSTVSRIDPALNEVVETIEIGNAPYGLAVSGDLVWVAVQAP